MVVVSTDLWHCFGSFRGDDSGNIPGNYKTRIHRQTLVLAMNLDSPPLGQDFRKDSTCSVG